MSFGPEDAPDGPNDDRIPDDGRFGNEEGRVSVRLGDWEPPEQYNQPILEPEGDTRTKEHKVLADVSVVQKLGENAERFTLTGDGFYADIAALRAMKGEEHSLRHPIYSGNVLLKSVSVTSTSSWEEKYGVTYWVYRYTLDLIEVV